MADPMEGTRRNPRDTAFHTTGNIHFGVKVLPTRSFTLACGVWHCTQM